MALLLLSPKQILLHLPLPLNLFSVLFLMQWCKWAFQRKVGFFMNGWYGGQVWLYAGLWLIAMWFISAGYVRRAAGSRYPNSCGEKLKGAAACWESRRIALRTPWSTASSSRGALGGENRENSSSWQPHWQAVGENINWPFRVKVWGPNGNLGGGVTNGDKLFGHPQRRGWVKRDPSSRPSVPSPRWKTSAQRQILASWNPKPSF